RSAHPEPREDRLARDHGVLRRYRIASGSRVHAVGSAGAARDARGHVVVDGGRVMNTSYELDLRQEARRERPSLGPSAPLALFEAARATWRGRMVNEYASSAVFDGLALQLERAGLGAEVVETCRRFADEERRHGVLCGAVVEALGGEARA